jgi:hypothetical protein
MPSKKDIYSVPCDSCGKPIEGKSFIVNSKVEDEIWIYHESPMDCANAVLPTRIRTKILNGRAYGRV